MRQRLLWVCTAVFVGVFILAGRLFLVMLFPDQFIGGNSPYHRWQSTVRARADLEHFVVVRSDDARGRILFRNGAPWSGFKGRTHSGWMHREDVPPTVGKVVVGVVGKPDIWPQSHMAVAELGRSGLEGRFDTVLRGYRPGLVAKFAAQGDARTFTSAPKPGVDVRTTVDSVWEAMASRALHEARVQTGAVVVLDVNSNEILAMASVGGSFGENEAVEVTVPGSIFKIVTAAAAYDSFLFRPHSEFFCDGHVPIRGVHMSCWTKHGRLTLTDAIAESCDTTFAEVGVQLHRTALSQIAHRLGIDSTGLQSVDGKSVLPEAQAGRVFARSGNDAGLLANTAIGQEDVRLSPVQGALLASAVANHGSTKPASLVLAALSHETVLRDYKIRTWHDGFSDFAALQIASGMRQAVTSPRGTAHDLADLPIAVKTGTAEVPGGRVNAWMVGFFPVQKPEIAFAVLVKNASSQQGHLEVRKIVRALSNTYMQFHPKPHI